MAWISPQRQARDTAIIREITVLKYSFTRIADRYQITTAEVQKVYDREERRLMDEAFHVYVKACRFRQIDPVPWQIWRYSAGIWQR